MILQKKGDHSPRQLKKKYRPTHSSVMNNWTRSCSLGLPPHVSDFIVSFSLPLEEYVMEKVGPALLRIKADEFSTKFRGLSQLRQLVGKESEEGQIAIKAVFEDQMVPVLLEYMNNYRLQFEAEWTIASLTSAPRQHLQVLYRHKAIKVLMDKLHSTALEAVDQAVWAIGNLAYSYQTRMTIISHDIVPQLCKIVNTCLTPDEHLSKPEALPRVPVKKSLLRSSVWTVSRLCAIQHNERPVEWVYLSACLPALVRVLQESEDNETLSDACSALSNLSEQMSAEEILATGILPRLVHFLGSDCRYIRAPCVRTIGNILAGSEHHTQEVINSGALQSLSTLLLDGSVYLRKASAWAISNITAGSLDQIEHVLQSGCLSVLVHMVMHDEHVAAREASWVISNIVTGGTVDHIRICGGVRCADALHVLLDRSTDLDDETVSAIVEALHTLFQIDASYISNFQSLRNKLEELSLESDLHRTEICELIDVMDRYFQSSCDALEK